MYGFWHSRIMLGLRTNHWSRREFLSVGSLGLGSLALPELLRAEVIALNAARMRRQMILGDIQEMESELS